MGRVAFCLIVTIIKRSKVGQKKNLDHPLGSIYVTQKGGGGKYKIQLENLVSNIA